MRCLCLCGSKHPLGEQVKSVQSIWSQPQSVSLAREFIREKSVLEGSANAEGPSLKAMIIEVAGCGKGKSLQRRFIVLAAFHFSPHIPCFYLVTYPRFRDSPMLLVETIRHHPSPVEAERSRQKGSEPPFPFQTFSIYVSLKPFSLLILLCCCLEHFDAHIDFIEVVWAGK